MLQDIINNIQGLKSTSHKPSKALGPSDSFGELPFSDIFGDFHWGAKNNRSKIAILWNIGE
jgi:hypothetical protein